ncbi:hypothetical protein [Novosphingobium sp. ST904]|nr:hypothetical protein [Novosphingobium sp. ST904]
MPDNPAPYLTDWLIEIGPAAPGGDPLGWRDLAAWQDITGIELEPWEGRLIRRLSTDFVSQRHKAEKADCPPPYTGIEDDIPAMRQRVSAQIAAIFG